MGQHRSIGKVLTHFFLKRQLYWEEFPCSAHMFGTEVLEQLLPSGHCHWLVGERKQRGKQCSAVQCGANYNRDLALDPLARATSGCAGPQHGFVQ